MEQKADGTWKGVAQMNLINDPWIPVIRQNNSRKLVKIAPWQIVETDNPVVDIAAPRADFQGALYQFLIGLLQTTFAPEDQDEWNEFWVAPPSKEQLRQSFAKYEKVFDITFEEGTAFMQDKENFEGELLPIEDLVGGELSDNTRLKNRDLFVKRGSISIVSPYWAALALFNLQTTGVLAWGKHRVGLRGNGPVTTLALPDRDSTLWEKLWLNILSKDDGLIIPGSWAKHEFADIFPWMSETRTSEKKEATLPDDCNPLQHYWPMPRRIRLEIEQIDTVCDISGEHLSFGVRNYKRKPNGVYYTGPWQHPLSPYEKSNDKEKSPKVLTGNNLSYGYRDWSALICGGTNGKNNLVISYVVNINLYERELDELKFWCFGYRAENANVSGFVNKMLPTFNIHSETKEKVSQWVGDLLAVSEEILEVNYEIIAAAFWGVKDEEKKRNKLAISNFKKNKQLEIDFWARTESSFFELLKELIERIGKRFLPLDVAEKWLKCNKFTAFSLFDEYVLETNVEDGKIRRIFKAKSLLNSEINKKKSVKNLKTLINQNQVEVA